MQDIGEHLLKSPFFYWDWIWTQEKVESQRDPPQEYLCAYGVFESCRAYNKTKKVEGRQKTSAFLLF
jgi:hypothetical protein